MPFFVWLQALPVSQSILTGTWLHPMLLVGHSIGMGVVVGIIFMLDLKVLGLARGVSLSIFHKLIALGWIGFGLNAMTGALMFMAYAATLAANWTFQLKIICILAGGVCLWLLGRSLAPVDADAPDPAFGRNAKILAVVTLLFWLGAIATGRLIAYTAPEGT